MKRIAIFLLALGAFMISTCGAADDVLPQRVADTKFSQDRGFYATAFELSITCATPGATILYTLDGSEPTQGNGTAGASPAIIRIATTTVVRAKAVHPDFEPTNTDTQSYIFLNDVIHQLAVVPGYPNPWSWMGGDKYTLHDYEMDPEIVNDPAYRDMILDALRAIPTMSVAANPEYLDDFYWGQRERPCSLEIIDPCDPKQSEQVDAGVEPHSHDRLKRSLRLNFRAEYGQSKFKTTLFRNAPFHGDTATDTVDRVILRGGNNRCWARSWNPDKTAYTIDQFYRDLQIAVSGHGARGTFVHLYINGLYWGLYNPTERPDHWFAADYFGGQVENWFSCNHAGTLQGDRRRFDYLTRTLVDTDLTDSANYEHVKEYLDVDNFIDYLLVTWWMGVGDWPGNNWYAANRNESSPLGPTGVRFFAWDGEWSWDASRADGPGAVHPDFRSHKTGGSAIPKLWHALRRNDDFMMRFADRAYQHLCHDGVLTDQNAQTRWLALNESIREAVAAESARWGDAMEPHGQPTRTRDLDWQREVDAIYHMIDGTSGRFLDNLRAEGYYPQIDPPVFSQRGWTGG